jgi:hypothetical protein
LVFHLSDRARNRGRGRVRVHHVKGNGN